MMKKNGTVFLVDDDVDDQEIFALALAEVDASLTCVTARNGLDALAQLQERSFRPDCIFIDLNMPRMNGKQCLKEIKNRPDLIMIPVIIYSTSSEKHDVEETRAMGAKAFITKPARIQDLVDSLERILLEL